MRKAAIGVAAVLLAVVRPCYEHRFVLRALDELDLRNYWGTRKAP
jgi:hypothetical protein